MSGGTEKRCPKCSQSKPVEDFAVARGRYDGRQTYCRACKARPKPSRQGKVVEGIGYIPLTRGMWAIVDPELVSELSIYRWTATKSQAGGWYAIRGASENGHRTFTPMHRQIMQAPEGTEVDHRNGNGLDNRRENLRLCTHAQNLANQRQGSPSKGIGRQRGGRWRARIKILGCEQHLGCFATAEEAATAYNRAALRLFGEFAALNPVGQC